MTQVSTSLVACPTCGTKYRWREEFAGKDLNCRCGTAFRAGPDGTFIPAPVNLPSSLLLGPGKSPIQRALETREDEVKPSRIRDRYLPVILLPVGAVAQLVLWTRLMGDVPTGGAVFSGALAVQLIVFCPLMFAAITTTAGWFDMALGNLFTVLLKVAALTLGAVGVCDVLFAAIMINTDFDHWSLVAGYGVYLVLCGLPALYMLEMQVHEMALIVLMIFIPRVMAIYIAALALPDIFR